LFVEEGIDSLKIEGRMKSHLYAGTMSKVYSEALEFYSLHQHLLSDDLIRWEEELRKVSHRDYTQASLVKKAGVESIFNERENSNEAEWRMVGSVVEASPLAGIVVEVKNAFNQGDVLEILPFKGANISLVVNEITDLSMRPISRTKPTSLVRLPYREGVNKMHLLRQRIKT
jgi:putative protease